MQIWKPKIKFLTIDRKLMLELKQVSYNNCTVKPALSGHSKIDKTKVLKTNGSLMKVKSIAEWSPWSIL